MINKRLLIKNLLSQNDENTFYDKKRKLSLDNKEGKAKFLKHICALSNSNPFNNSYILVGVEDKTNEIVGVDFYDDSRIQDLVNACLQNPPIIRYENISFPNLEVYKVVGLVTIIENENETSFKKNYWKYLKGTTFYRVGSNSVPFFKERPPLHNNLTLVKSLEKNAQNNLEIVLKGVFDFINNHLNSLSPTYKVFQEQFVVCWAGESSKENDKTYYSRVDIELINEQVRIFYSTLDKVQISYDQNSFQITEFINLEFNAKQKLYPLERTIIEFNNQGSYTINTQFLFHPPQFDLSHLHHIHNHNTSVLNKVLKKYPTTESDQNDLFAFPNTCLICYINGIDEARNLLLKVKPFLKENADKSAYIALKESLRIIRKLKYK